MKTATGRAKEQRRGMSTARVLLLVCMAACELVWAQSVGPTDNKGSTTKPLGNIDLASEIDGLSGRQLRARLVTVEPGGHLAAHSHKGRPTLEYVVQGNIIEVRNGVEIPHVAGDMVVATRDVSHWWENRSTAVAVLLPVDIYAP